MKKLTAGIFTVMMGLVAANSADAAVASKGYVDTKAAALVNASAETLQTAINAKVAQSDYDTKVAALEKADTDNLAAAKTYAEGQASAAQAAAEAAAESALSSAVEALEGQITSAGADTTALDNRVTAAEGEIDGLQTQVGEGTVDSRIATAKQEAVDAAAGDATTKANKALADAKTYADGLDSAQKTAFESADNAINEKIGTVAQGKTVVEMIADAQTAATYDDTKVKEDIAANAQAIAANGQAIEGNAGEISGLKTLVGTTAVADQIAAEFTKANLSQYATKDGLTGALAEYTKTTELKNLAFKDTVGTEQIDNGAVTTAKLADGAVDSNKLGKDAVTDNAVADGALSQGKINGLSATLNAKLNIPDAANETDGRYVLTATSVDGQATYYWESIER